MFLTTACLTVSCLAASELTLDKVAPEQTVFAISFEDLGDMMKRFEDNPAAEKFMGMDELKDPFMDQMPDPMSDALEAAMEDKSLVEVAQDMRMGMVLFPVVDQETTAVSIGMTMYLDLGESAESLGKVWDEAMEESQSSMPDDMKMELLEIGDTEVIRIDIEQAEDMDEEEDPFGGRGRGRGRGMGLSMEDASPKRFFMVRVDENILVSTSRSQMQRMLDVLEGEDVEGGLGGLDSWKGVNGFLGDSGFRMVLLTNHLGEMMESMGQPFLVNMAKPMVIAMFGRIDAIGFNMESAEAPALATFNMGAWIPDGKEGLMKLMSRNSPREPIPGWLSAESVSYGRLNFDFDGVIPWVKDVINSNPMMAMQGAQAMEQMEPMMQKFMDGMGSTVQMSSSISYPLTAESMGNIWAVDSKNAKSFTDTLSEMAPQMGFEPRDFQGHQIYSMETGGMLPGMPSEIAVAVGGGEIYMGAMSSVEQALRSVGSSTSEDSPAATTFKPIESMFSSEPVVYWTVSDMGRSMDAQAKVSMMQWSQEMESLRQEDPELAEELGEMMKDEIGPMAMFGELSEMIGLVGYEVTSVENGFKGTGWILSPVE
ncbi:MAG: hypothetical protein CMJ40_04200 [Phycisphaerae bacterium]|nr:hypothetical protein [Phycisphaerae bacterium]